MQASLERLKERRDRGDEGGFTLIELLIVIVILGILAAIVVFAVQNLTSQSSNAACQSDYKTVEVGAESYKAQMNAYPGATQNGVTDMLATATSPTSGGSVGPWLKDKPGGSKYQVVVGTSNLPGGTGSTPLSAAKTAYGQNGTTLQTPDGVIWVGTSTGTTPTVWTAGSGATVTLSGTTWTGAGNIYSYATAGDHTTAINGELTGTAQAACTSV